MTRFRDLAGQRFGMLVALHVDGKDPTGKTKWACHCDCGARASATMLNLVKGVTKSCGCLRRRPHPNRKNLSGMRFGALVAQRPYDGLRWVCLCDCGRETLTRTVHLTRAHSKSCGRCQPIAQSKRHTAKRARNSASAWARAVRSIGSCDACGSEESLHAHHIMPFASHPWAGMRPENGSCLCGTCHRRVHMAIRSGQSPGDAAASVLADSRGGMVQEMFSLMNEGLGGLYKARASLGSLIELEVKNG